MFLAFRPEVIPFVTGSLAVFGGLGLALRFLRRPRCAWLCFALALILAGYMLYFFRDPERTAPASPAAILAGADGVIMGIKSVEEKTHLKTNAVRISIFLSLVDVHVNRAPISGRVAATGLVHGARYFTFQEKSSELNHHTAILITNDVSACLVHQIAGPVARRVIQWLRLGQELKAGDRIGMMLFGSRLDLYLPESDVTVTARVGERVRAGESVVAILNKREPALPGSQP